MKKGKQLLDYCATQKAMIITHNASQMILEIHSNAGYCNEKYAHSRAGGHFPLLNNEKSPPNKGMILTNATIIKAGMSSAAKSQTGSIIFQCQRSGIPPSNAIQNGTFSATNADPSGQHDSRGSDK